MAEIQANHHRKASVRRRDSAGESVVGQVESSGEVVKVGESVWERAIEGIGGQVQMAKSLEGRDLGRDWA